MDMSGVKSIWAGGPALKHVWISVLMYYHTPHWDYWDCCCGTRTKRYGIVLGLVAPLFWLQLASILTMKCILSILAVIEQLWIFLSPWFIVHMIMRICNG